MTDREIADKFECQELVLKFIRHLDFHEADKMAELVTEDVEFDRRGQMIKGRDKLLEVYGGLPPHNVFRHLCTNILIDIVDENHAKGLTFFIFYRHGGDAAPDYPVLLDVPQVIGDIHDEFRRTEDGWRICRRQTQEIFSAPADLRLPSTKS